MESLELFLDRCHKCCLFKFEKRRAGETSELDQWRSSARAQVFSPFHRHRQTDGDECGLQEEANLLISQSGKKAIRGIL